jgi:hypothetical protein
VVDQIGNPLYLLVLFEVEAGGDRDFCELWPIFLSVDDVEEVKWAVEADGCLPLDEEGTGGAGEVEKAWRTRTPNVSLNLEWVRRWTLTPFPITPDKNHVPGQRLCGT